MNSQHASIPDRIWEKLELDGNGCWAWQASLSPSGYAHTSFGRKNRKLVHRAIYEVMVGPIPSGLVIDHLCRNRGCSNPAHLEPVTNAENLRRGMSGDNIREIARAARARATCKRGHPLSGKNLRASMSGRRMCRTCANMLNNERRKVARREAAALARSTFNDADNQREEGK